MKFMKLKMGAEKEKWSEVKYHKKIIIVPSLKIMTFKKSIQSKLTRASDSIKTAKKKTANSISKTVFYKDSISGTVKRFRS